MHHPTEMIVQLCYTSYGALAEMRNSSMGPPLRIDKMNYNTISKCYNLLLYMHSITDLQVFNSINIDYK